MKIRLAVLGDMEQMMQLIKAVVPLMHKSGNWQWDENYPNVAVFEEDIKLQQLWVAEIETFVVGIAAITTAQEPEYAQVGWDINEPAIVTHRHRYEFNNKYLKQFEKAGMIASAVNPDSKLVEIIELKDHPYFVGSQFHPELKSTVLNPHPLFVKFVKAAYEYQRTQDGTREKAK